ncbi:diguanylate cyclase (GGDEF) domain-containing protein [Xenococcus sp. PCC 7305]|uniref:diguanylate cyclase domain-containing protein n=1 Tax=Xenococcus sp. PCC 7305 TaxID=102125 RepID=UPI0002AC2AD9|nr:diguanylate cyclase [Xenococcus sp. PCC 7305]ELS01563.1 diguanylate cyclase (GGDEF) domain-containing protein [Xenococcus sp. PCC 7305]
MRRVIANYLLTEKIYESANSEVYRGSRESDRRSFILKVLKQDYPTAQELTRYKQEYEITRNLNLDGVIKAYSLEPYQRTLAIILEDFGASSLKKLMNDSSLFPQAKSVAERTKAFLRLAIKITETLGQIHTTNIIHKDINPSNIVLNPDSQEVKIIDFGLSTILTRENPTLKHPNVLEGTLAYISPEQTGRMNRSLDYRTDFYSLGVTFYELLTEQLPFPTADAMELVHCQIAKQPVPPSELLERHGDDDFRTTVISDIIMKLMAKTAESRYQSAWGLKADLEKCLRQLETTGIIEEFPLGSQDISDNFQIPQKLYGREQEIETLLAAFERVAAGGRGSEIQELEGKLNRAENKVPLEMMLVAGYSGIGKSALVQEIHKPITEKRGHFISGKFDQFQRNIPYSAIASAFQGLVTQLLTENSESLNQWREKLLAALGANAQVIIDVIPEVELIIGKQSAVSSLGPIESQNRFNLVFGNFIRVFCNQEHPLVIFLDDLQWVDSATLKLIELMVTDNDTQYLFLIGAYRDNEVSSNHPLTITLKELQKQAVIINQITLAPLALDSVVQILAETLYCDRGSDSFADRAVPTERSRGSDSFADRAVPTERSRGSDSFAARLSVQPLAELVMSKTRGNPFFVNQFLKTLHLENLLKFDFDRLCWQWDIAQIKAMDITDNVVELMISKVKRLPSPTQRALRLAACVGASFDLRTLSIICEQSTSEVFQHLLPAVQSGLILTISELDEDLLIQDYKFSHDRIQQAAYALIEENIKKPIHLQIGRLLLANLSAQQRLTRLFELVDHLNMGRELIADAREQTELLTLNLEAGQKAKQATAYAAALQYVTIGMEYLSKNSWAENYELTFKLTQEKSELEYLNGNYEQAEFLIMLLLEKARSSIEKADTYSFLVLLYTMLGEYLEAIEAGRKALKLLGIDLPKDNWLDALNQELIEAKANLGDKPIISLSDAPEMVIPEKKIAIKLLKNLLTPAYVLNQDLFGLICSKSANISFQYGAHPESAMAYGSYATTLLSRLDDYQSAYEFGLVGLKISERFNDLANKCKACNMLANHIIHWIKHSKYAQAINDEGYKVGLESGEIQFVGYILHSQVVHGFFEGKNLQDLLAVIPNSLLFASQPKNILAYDTLFAYQLTIVNLIGKTHVQHSLVQQEITEEKYLENCQLQKNDFSLCYYYICKSYTHYLFHQYNLALEYSTKAKKILSLIRGMVAEADQNYYASLSSVAIYSSATAPEQQAYWSKIESNQKQMKIWADNCPENFLHRYLLVEAEIARVAGQDLEAMELYDRAIASAAENKFIQNEALANELAAKFWLIHGKEEFAQLYLKKAHYGYQLWGAQRKVEDLEKKYPQLLSRAFTTTKQEIQSTSNISSESNSSVLDLTTVIKASQALASEIVLDKLLANLMKILIENAGAQTGILILPLIREGIEPDAWVIEAAGVADSEEVKILQSIPIDAINAATQLTHLSTSIVNYVLRTQESLVLKNAAFESKFIGDPYIVATQTKSVLCAPLLNQGKLNGIIYLENNLTTGAFTSERVEILRILSAQAAVSIENSRLYAKLEDYSHTLEKKVEERTKELQNANQELERLANLDGLTKLANRRYFDEYLAREWKRMLREQKSLSLILFDVDFFKRYNDHYGHQAGDDCLVKVAQAAKQAVKRPADLVARYGGEEFVVVLPNTDFEGASAIAKRIQDELQQFQIAHEKSEVSPFLTISIGLTYQIPTPGHDCKQMVGEADAALYMAKRQGRNRYCLYSPPTPN